MARSLTGISVLLVLVAKTAPAGDQTIVPCEGVEIVAPDSGERQMLHKVGVATCRGRRRLGPLFGGLGGSMLRVRVCANMADFRKLTGRPWYVSAVVLGEEIVTQPLDSLRKLDNLPGTLAHELVHLLVRRKAGRNCPRWLDEGLAQWLSGQKAGLLHEPAVLPGNHGQLDRLECRLRSTPAAREQLERDYRVCLWLVDRLIGRVGERTLIEAMAGLKKHSDPLRLPLKGRTLGGWMFRLDD